MSKQDEFFESVALVNKANEKLSEWEKRMNQILFCHDDTDDTKPLPENLIAELNRVSEAGYFFVRSLLSSVIGIEEDRRAGDRQRPFFDVGQDFQRCFWEKMAEPLETRVIEWQDLDWQDE